MRCKYNGGFWTPARFNSFVKGGLRGISRRWPPKYQCLEAACIGKKLNDKSGRLAKHYQCAACSGLFPAKDVQVDHINPVIDPVEGFTTWDDVINNMFCEAENLQVLCTECHRAKTAAERKIKTKKEPNAE